MAQHGGSLPAAARVVSPQPTRPASRHQPPSAAALVNNNREITLSQPRPGSCRIQNDYIDTPIRPRAARPKSPSRPKDASGSPSPAPEPLSFRPAGAAASALPGVHGSPGTRSGALGNTQLPVTAQPSATFKKDKLTESVGGDGSEGGGADDAGHGESIICRQCGRCKCDSCRKPKPLPSRWICNDKYLCSAQTVVDYCSCMCCVKGLYYHWAKDYEMDNDVSCADRPCSCVPHQRCLRWGCLSLLSTVLPCLCCYWPLKGCVKLCELCYAEVSSHGCHCSQRRTTSKPPEQTAPEKRLLDSNSDC